jgi:hypothetical protein
MDLAQCRADIEAKLAELAQQYTDAQALLSRIVEQRIFYSGQHALLVDLTGRDVSAAEPSASNDAPTTLS